MFLEIIIAYILTIGAVHKTQKKAKSLPSEVVPDNGDPVNTQRQMTGVHWRGLDGLAAELRLRLDDVTHKPRLGEGVSEPTMFRT